MAFVIRILLHMFSRNSIEDAPRMHISCLNIRSLLLSNSNKAAK